MSFSFGSTSVAQPAASSGFSFGAAPAAAPAPTSTGFSFGGAAPAAAPASSSGFSFGNATPAPTSSGFSFGNATTTPAPTATSSSSGFAFGASTGGASAPAPASSSGFSFGNAPSTAARSLFGATPTATATAAPTTGTGFFGSGNAITTTNTSSLFGAPANNTSSFFGAPAAPTAAGTTSNVFGAPAPAATSSFGLFGTAPTPPQPNGQGITLETPFEALPSDVQANIVAFHKRLKAADEADALVKTVTPEPLYTLQTNIAQLEQDVLAHRNAQDRQATAVHHVRKDVKHAIRHVDAAALSLRTLDGLATSNMYSSIVRHVETPSPFYWDLLAHYEAQMSAIKSQIEALEREFRPLVDATYTNPSTSEVNVEPMRLQQILVAQNAALVYVAARVADVHERADALRQQFLAAMRADLARLGSSESLTNPFDRRKQAANAAADKRDVIDKIRFRTSVAPTIVAPAPTPTAPTPQLGLGLATTGFGGFGGFGAAAATTTGFSGFGTVAPAATSAAPTTTTTSLFGTTATPAATNTTSGFGFGAAAPKTVSFNLAAPSTNSTSAFAVPSVATTGSAFGSVASTFLPPTTGSGDNEKRAASTKRLSSRPKKRA